MSDGGSDRHDLFGLETGRVEVVRESTERRGIEEVVGVELDKVLFGELRDEVNLPSTLFKVVPSRVDVDPEVTRPMSESISFVALA